MAIEESKIIDLIAGYEGYEEECRSSWDTANLQRAALYRTIIKDLESLLPRKSLADLDVPHFSDLTGTIVEYGGKRGVLLGGGGDMVILFTLADKWVTYTYPSLVHVLDEERIWDETGAIL